MFWAEQVIYKQGILFYKDFPVLKCCNTNENEIDTFLFF